jgi:hypothetical protein
MKALISPNEVRETGYRVAEVAANTFDVAQPLFWVDCDNSIVADQFWFNPETSSFEVMPEPEIVVPVATEPQPISQGAQNL